MMRDQAIGVAIMVKTPGYSPVKTRIARVAGHHWAEALHRLAAAAVRSVVLQAVAESRRSGGPTLAAYWAVAETFACTPVCWPGLPILRQHGEGGVADGLGARMACVHAQLLDRHAGGLLLGADAPQIDATSILQAARHLARTCASQVIGPSCDGGFWLFGSNREVSGRTWLDTPYSDPQTLDRFVAALDPSSELLTLDAVTDIDEPADVATAMAALEARQTLTAEQHALRDWLASNPAPKAEVPT
jgi:glycosyltransferase A (GT-A) superfamily protein (DUF2064 family)